LYATPEPLVPADALQQWRHRGARKCLAELGRRPVEAKIDHAVKQIQAMVAARQASGLSQRFV
jgi:hypothetical protein